MERVDVGPLLDSKEQVEGLVFIGEVVSNGGAGWASRRQKETSRSISAKLEEWRESYLLDSTRLTLTLALYPASLSSVARINRIPAGSGVVSCRRSLAFRGAREVGEQRRGGMFSTAERSGSRKSMKTNTILGTRLPCRRRLRSVAAIPQFVVTLTSLTAGFLEFEPKLLKNAAVLRQTSLFEIRGSILTYLVCCEITFEHKDFKLGKSITQSVLNGFAPKKLQNFQKIRGYKTPLSGRNFGSLPQPTVHAQVTCDLSAGLQAERKLTYKLLVYLNYWLPANTTSTSPMDCASPGSASLVDLEKFPPSHHAVTASKLVLSLHVELQPTHNPQPPLLTSNGITFGPKESAPIMVIEDIRSSIEVSYHPSIDMLSSNGERLFSNGAMSRYRLDPPV
ncbi:hypothetical protein BDZ97DRAFT_1951103 [Flammula alnicola]|nr:hypothetical protein BDZ97DRAFT_1951103 [Flammula alnicola]